MTIGKRVWHKNHLATARLAAAMGFRSHNLVRVVSDADLVLDVSGGDSFTDLYGEARFRSIVAPKEIALSLGRRLVLLPQTYGPFKSEKTRHTARRLIGGAALAYARDPDSLARLRDLLEDRFDPNRHRLGVDLAFALPAQQPTALEASVAAALAARGERALIGLNVSGLLMNRQRQAASRFGLACDYPSLMRRLVMQLLDETAARLLVLPHVHAPHGHYESDLDASVALLDSLPEKYALAVKQRVAVLNKPLDACELKWLIARCDWFCGARMHATIAAVSSGVPTAAIAYSKKTLGVFKTCDAAEAVVDLRHYAEEEAVEQLIRSWHRRADSASKLSQALPRVRAVAVRQLDAIADCARHHRAPEMALQC
jgi:polysaccharide pyruvyl transferase WcaK-like protein